jgi:peptide/nickel transport system permease protein
MTTTANTKVAEIIAAEPMPEEQSQLQIVIRRFRKHKLAVFSLVLMTAIFLISIFAKQIAPLAPDAIEVANPYAALFSVSQATGLRHWLGTDNLGRDYFTRIIYAARVSLTVSVTCTLASAVIGVIIGAVAGYYGGIIDAILSRFLEFLLTIPTLPVLLIISAILLQNPDILPIPRVVIKFMGSLMLIPDNQALQAVVIISILVAFGWLQEAQLMRGMVLSLREQQFVEASRAMGANDAYIIFRHMIPNSMAPIIVSASLALGGFIILEAALSFLGFGIQDPTPTWGNMLATTESYMFQHPWLPIIPGTPILICSLAFNFIGDGLRDALDPRLKL